MPYVNPIIAWENNFRDAYPWTDDPVGNPPRLGFEKESVGDWLTYQKWIPTYTTLAGFTAQVGAAQEIDYFGIAGFNLRYATIVLQYWDGFSYVNCFAPTYAYNELFFITFNKIILPSPGLLRVQVTAAVGSEPIQIGVLATGRRLEVPFPIEVPFIQPRYARRDEIMTARSEAGEYLGRTVLYRGAEFDVTFDLLPPNYINSIAPYGGIVTGLADTLNHLASGLPCFFSWNQTSRPADTAFCMLRGGANGIKISRNTPLHNRLELQFEGVVMSNYYGAAL